MSWNYRVVQSAVGLRIFDVYYTDDGRPIAVNATPSYVYGSTVDDLRAQLALMAEALQQPILNEAEIGRQSSEA